MRADRRICIINPVHTYSDRQLMQWHLGLVNIVLISPIILGRDLHLISSFQTRNIGTPTCQATKTVPMPAVPC